MFWLIHVKGWDLTLYGEYDTVDGVDGHNSAPPRMMIIPVVVWDFFRQQYHILDHCGNHQQQPANTKRWHPAAGQEGKQQGYFQPFRSVTCQRGWWVFFGMFVYRSLFIDQGLLGFPPFGDRIWCHMYGEFEGFSLRKNSAWSLGWRHRMTPCRHGPCFQEIASLVRGLLRKYDGG